MIELKQKAKEYNKKNFGKIIADRNVWTSTENAYIAGAMENGVIRHDLKKDPSDLPNTDRNVIVYREDEEPTMDNYIRDEDFVGWESKRYNIEYCKRKGYMIPYDDTIGWCEVPQF